VSITLRRDGSDAVLAIADDGVGMRGASDGTGLSIVRALVRDELGGSLDLSSEAGLRVAVRFPA
jgi:two-component sensor histidine kinase